MNTTSSLTPKWKLALAAGIAWVVFVMASYAKVWSLSFSSFNALLEKFVDGGWLFYVHLTVFFFTLNFLFRSTISPHQRVLRLSSFLILSFFIFILMAGSVGALPEILLTATWIFIVGLGFRSVLEKQLRMETPLYAGILSALTVIEVVLFVAGNLNLAGYGLKLALLILMPLTILASGIEFHKDFYKKRKKFLEELSPAGWIFIEGGFLILCLTLLHAFVPETLIDADALHIPKAEKIANSSGFGVLTGFPFNIYSMILSATHINFSFFYSFGGESAIKGFTWCLFLVTGMAVTDVGKILNIRTSLVLAATLIFLYCPAYVWHYGSGYVDLPAALFGIAAAAFLLRGLKEKENCKKCFFISGVFFGVAVACKITLIVWVFAFALAAVALWVLKIIKLESRFFVESVLLVGFGVLLFAGPYFIYHYWVLGNPFFPALNGFFLSPYLNSSVELLKYQQFSTIDFLSFLFFPFYLVLNTSWFGSTVEYQDGGSGVWFLLFCPFLLLGLIRHRKNDLFLLAFFGSAGFILLMYFMGTVYIRYYIPALAVLFCLMAKGSEVFIEFFSDFEFAKAKYFCAGISVLIIALSFPQFTFSTVWSPSISHWENYRKGTNLTWLDSQQPGFKEIQDLVKTLPKNKDVIFFGAMGASHFPGQGTFFQPLDILLTSRVGAKFSDEHLRLLKTNFWKFFNEFIEGRIDGAFDQEIVDRILKENGDVIVFNSLKFIKYLGQSEYTKIENLLYSSSSHPGVYPKGYVVFALNEDLLYADKGRKMQGFGPGGLKIEDLGRRSQFISSSGRLENPINSNDIWASHDRYFYNLYDIPEKSKRVKFGLDLIFDEISDFYPGIQLNWLDLNNNIIEMSALGVMYDDNSVATLAIKDIPDNAKKVAVVVRPNKDRRIGIKKGELLFIP